MAVVCALAGAQGLGKTQDQAWALRERGAELVAQALTLWDLAVNHISGDQLIPEQITPCAVLANWVVDHLTITGPLPSCAHRRRSTPGL